MRGILTTLYVISGIALLAIPGLQVRLHWKLARPDSGSLKQTLIQNHVLFLVAVAALAGLYYCVNPEANIRVDLLLAIPISVIILLLWGMLILRASHLKQ